MNYQHIYHAGNFADVIKHTVLITLIHYLQRKEKPICVIDVHAGAGLYDLQSKEAQKNREYEQGIFRLFTEVQSHLVEAAQWLKNNVKENNRSVTDIQFYPGSPLIVQALLRANDRLLLVEKHPQIYKELKMNIGKDTRIAVHCRDAYEALNALLPPRPRRGLVLIDPPFEDKNEFQHLTTGLRAALLRWPEGIFIIWYPLKASSDLARFYYDLRALPCNEITKVEVQVRPDSERGLLGCGIIIINSPWQFYDDLNQLIKNISPLLFQCDTAKSSIKIIKKQSE